EPTTSPLPLPRISSTTYAALELISSAESAAKQAPHRNAMSSSRGGSGSQRSIQRNVATTGPTGSSAHSAPTTTPPTPTLVPTSPSAHTRPTRAAAVSEAAAVSAPLSGAV